MKRCSFRTQQKVGQVFFKCKDGVSQPLYGCTLLHLYCIPETKNITSAFVDQQTVKLQEILVCEKCIHNKPG